MNGANTNSSCHSKQLATNYQANRHLMWHNSEFKRIVCFYKTLDLRSKLMPCFLRKCFFRWDTIAGFKHSLAKDSSVKTLALSKPLHQCLANLFSSSVKIMSEGVDKHLMARGKKSFRIHPFWFWQLLYYPDKYFANECFYRLSTVMAAGSFVISFISFEGLTQ